MQRGTGLPAEEGSLKNLNMAKDFQRVKSSSVVSFRKNLEMAKDSVAPFVHESARV